LLKRLITILTFFYISVTCLTVELNSQVVYEPLYNDVYSFLLRMSTKGVIGYNDEFRPLPRKYIAEKLLEAEKQKNHLTEVELSDLEFYKKDYYNEIGFTNKNSGCGSLY